MLPAMAKPAKRAIPEVPKAVFERFLTELSKDKALAEVVGRLRPVLLEEDTIVEPAIKAALLPDGPDNSSS
jgi:hypothetical protein